MGPNSANRVTMETNDIAFHSTQNQETTSGSIVWENGELGEKNINLFVNSSIFVDQLLYIMNNIHY